MARKNTNRIVVIFCDDLLGDPEMALHKLWLHKSYIDPRICRILFGAVQGNSPKHKKALQHPAFKDDPSMTWISNIGDYDEKTI